MFTRALSAQFGFNQHPGHDVASLNKTLYDDNLSLVALNQLQTERQKFNESTTAETLGHWKLLSRRGFLQI